jgi:hypothetical protein
VLIMRASAGRPRRKAAVSIFPVHTDAVRGGTVALLGCETLFLAGVLGARFGVVWAKAGPHRATSVRPSRKRG